uniref:Uncharacterized protein n=1 Tax=Macaca fascicularis TaxID=9541 RepID=A0A7N9D0G1_MACFA
IMWKNNLKMMYPQVYLSCLILVVLLKKGSRVHVHNVQVCYICIHVPCWCTAPINSSSPINSSFTSG